VVVAHHPSCRLITSEPFVLVIIAYELIKSIAFIEYSVLRSDIQRQSDLLSDTVHRAVPFSILGSG